MAKSWGSTKGTAANDKNDYLSFKAGKTVIRIVSGVLPRYVYWLKNPEGKSAPFECLRFNRETEKFIPGAKDPVQTLGLKEKTQEGEEKALSPKKNYICWVIDRSDNKLKLMEVKATILKGIQSAMGQLELDDPSSVDFTIEKTGKGFDTEYKVLEIAASKFLSKVSVEGTPENEQHKADAELLGEWLEDEDRYENTKSLEEVFAVPTYDEALASMTAFIEGTREDGDNKNKPAADEANREAASELED